MNDAPHIVCPHCFVSNRIAAGKPPLAAKCGRCKQALFDGEPVELVATQFQNFIERNDLPVVVDFWAPWCGPCKMMAPVFKDAARALEPRARLAKVNTEQEGELAGHLGIRSIPTLIIFKQGREIARQAGALDGTSLLRWLQSHLAG